MEPLNVLWLHMSRAIFAPIFVPLFMKLNVAPVVVLAAYRVADSPPHVITPLMPYFGLIVVFVQRYQQEAGVWTVVAMMLPYHVGVFVVWTPLLVGLVSAGAASGAEVNGRTGVS